MTQLASKTTRVSGVVLLSTVACVASLAACKARSYNEKGGIRSENSASSEFRLSSDAKITFVAEKGILDEKGNRAVCYFAATRNIPKNLTTGSKIDAKVYEALVAEAREHLTLVIPYNQADAKALSSQISGTNVLEGVAQKKGKRTPVSSVHYVYESSFLDSLQSSTGQKSSNEGGGWKFLKGAADKTMRGALAVVFAPVAVGAGAVWGGIGLLSSATTPGASIKSVAKDTASSVQDVGKGYWAFVKAMTPDGVASETVADVKSLLGPTETIPASEFLGLKSPDAVSDSLTTYLNDKAEAAASDSEKDNASAWTTDAAALEAGGTYDGARFAFEQRLALQHLVSLAHVKNDSLPECCPKSAAVSGSQYTYKNCIEK